MNAASDELPGVTAHGKEPTLTRVPGLPASVVAGSAVHRRTHGGDRVNP